MHNKIRELIAEDKLKEAIELLRNNAKTNGLLNDVIMQSAKYNEVKNLIRNDIISFEQANISKAKIRNALLELVVELENNKPLRNKTRNLTKKILLFIFSLVFVALIIFWMKLESTQTTQNSFAEETEKVPFEEDRVKNEENISRTSDDTESEESTEATLPKPVREPKRVVKVPKNKGKKFPIIKGRVVDNNDKGIANTLIITSDGSEVKTNKLGLFRLTLKKPIDEYPSKIYLYYSKDSLESKSLIRVGQKNIILKF